MRQARQISHLLGAILASRWRHVRSLVPAEGGLHRLDKGGFTGKDAQFVEGSNGGHWAAAVPAADVYTKLGKHFLDYVTGNVCQPEVAALEAVGELEMVETEEMQNGGVEIVDVD